MEAYTYTHLIDHGMVYNTMVCGQGTLYISNVVYCRLFEQNLNIYVYLLQKRRMIMDSSQWRLDEIGHIFDFEPLDVTYSYVFRYFKQI